MKKRLSLLSLLLFIPSSCSCFDNMWFNKDISPIGETYEIVIY